MSDALRAPDVDYLTRDYEGFRQLLLSLIERADTRWTERSAADLGVTLVEILAQQLDLLAYAGDRVAEEGFLGTARRRESARRHAKLGDYDLDRGNATRGYQHFRLRDDRRGDQALLLRAGARVGQQLAPGQDPALRLVAETTEDALLDARRNEFALARSAAAGATALHLAAADGSRPGLRSLGLRPGLCLCVLDRERGEIATLRGVRGAVAELAAPLKRTYLAGPDGATRVLGNLVPIRRGETLPWQLVGRGGASLAGSPPAGGAGPNEAERSAGAFLALRLDPMRRLRAEVEAAREAWGHDDSLADRWRLANATVARVARQLREGGGAALGAEQARGLDADLGRAAELLRDVLRAAGRTVPEALRPTRRAPLRGQEIELRNVPLRRPTGEPRAPLPPLCLDGATTLEVRVGVAGWWQPWDEVEDFLRSGPDDRHYVAQTDAEGHVTLRFGDGEHGALLPPDARVMVRRVTGPLEVGDLGARALDVLLDDGDPEAPLDRDAFDAVEPTFNPLPTQGGRPPEGLADLPDRLRRRLARRVVPVTASDYEQLLRDRADIAEAKASVARELSRERVDVVLRPEPGADPTRVLDEVRALLRRDRLAGTDVWVRLPEPLYASLAVLVEVHPEVSPADLRLRLRRQLLEIFEGPEGARLGRARTRAEIYAAVEAVPGVVYSEVIGFDLAPPLGGVLALREAIEPAPHQIVRCLDLPDRPLGGVITLWAARRFRLLVELAFPDPDEGYDVEQLRTAIEGLLSGPDATPIREQWTEITAARIDELLRRVPAPGGQYRLSVRRLMVGERAVERVPIGKHELPVLDHVRIRERQFLPHYGLALQLSGGGAPLDEAQLRRQIKEKLSGPESVPLAKGWRELSPAAIDGVLSALVEGTGYELSVRSITVPAGGGEGAPALSPGVPALGTRRAVAIVPLQPGDVPILDVLQIAFAPGGP
jgi:hypothetical protein